MAANIVVLMKQVPDNTKLRVDSVLSAMPAPGGASPVDMMMNPFDEYAFETALRLKDSWGGDTTVTTLSLGHDSVKALLKKAIAAGADAAFIVGETAALDGFQRATILSKAVQTLVPDAVLVLAGHSSLDEAGHQTAAMSAEALGWPSLSSVKLAEGDTSSLTVSRVGDGGLEQHRMTLPGVLATIKCDYELRTSNIKGVMKANKTDIPVKSLADIGVSLPTATTTLTQLAPRPAKAAGQVINADGNEDAAIDAVVAYLKEQKFA
jgi:electron transfer flavoprotein beta subunit